MEKRETPQDEGMKRIFRSLDDAQAPFGLEDRIMRAVKADADQRLAVQKYLRFALAGVALTLLLIAGLVVTSGNLPAKTYLPGLDSGAFILLLSVLGLFFLFVEMELVVKFWLRKHFAGREKNH